MTSLEKPIKKRPVNGKSKGNGFELTIAKLLSSTLSPLVFKRTQQSGAIVGGFNVVNTSSYSSEMLLAFVGDIFPSNEADVLRDHGWRAARTVECKFYKEADSFSSLFKNPQLVSWFEQAAADAAKLENRAPLLIFKFNHTPVFYALDKDDIRPNNISSSMELRYNAKYNGKQVSRTIFIGLLDDALTDIEWWKLYESKDSKETS